MTGRRIFFGILLSVILLFGGTPNVDAAVPLIVQVGPLSNIVSVVASLGGTLVDRIPGTNIYLLNVPVVPSSLLTSLLGIQWTELNRGVSLPAVSMPVTLRVPDSLPADWYKNQPSMLLIHSGQALNYSRGRGVVVADLNSKVDVAHPALIGHLTTGYDFVTTKPRGSTALDQSSSSFMDGNPAYSHSTLCAGIIAVVAPDSMIMPLRVFDDQGEADLFTIAKALRYAVNQGALVVNMSFGTLENSAAIKSAVDYAVSKNVVLVASAGNNNTSAVQYPAAYSGVLATAATDLFDKKASFSNFNNYVYVDAPGVNIFSAYPQGDYRIVSGTSFSAPVIAGTAALIRSMQADGVEEGIAAGAVNIDAKNPRYVKQLGYGRIDILQAVKVQ